MSKDKKFSSVLKLSMSSPELLMSPPFLKYLEKESIKKKIDPMLFFKNNKKYLKKIKH